MILVHSIAVFLHHYPFFQLGLALCTFAFKWSSTAFYNVSWIKIFYPMTFYIIYHSIILANLNRIGIIIRLKRLDIILVKFIHWTRPFHIITELLFCFIITRLIICFSESKWSRNRRCPCIAKLIVTFFYWLLPPLITTWTKYTNLRNSLHFFLYFWFLYFFLISIKISSSSDFDGKILKTSLMEFIDNVLLKKVSWQKKIINYHKTNGSMKI